MHTYIYITIHCIELQCIALQYIHTYIHTYMHAYIHTCLHACIYTYIHIYLSTYLHLYIYTCIHTYMHICIYVNEDIYIYIYIHVYRGFRQAAGRMQRLSSAQLASKIDDTVPYSKARFRFQSSNLVSYLEEAAPPTRLEGYREG